MNWLIYIVLKNQKKDGAFLKMLDVILNNEDFEDRKPQTSSEVRRQIQQSYGISLDEREFFKMVNDGCDWKLINKERAKQGKVLISTPLTRKIRDYLKQGDLLISGEAVKNNGKQ